MAACFFQTMLCLNLVASVSYLVFRGSAFAGRHHISEACRCNGTTVILFLYVIPFYKLLPGLPKTVAQGDLISAMSSGGAWEISVLPKEDAAASISKVAAYLTKDTACSLSLDWQRGIFVLWAAVAVLLAVWNILVFVRFRYEIGKSQVIAHAMLQEIADRCAAQLGIRKKVILRGYPAIQTPMLVGFFTPTILLPDDELPPDEARMILTHELVHFKHGDLWRKVFAVILQTVYWFNPVVHVIKRDLECLAETSCDEQVVCEMNQAERKKYGHLLISSTSVFRSPKKVSGMAFVSTRKRLERRILTMLYSNKKSRKTVVTALACTLCASCLGVSVLAAESSSVIDVPNGELINVADMKVGEMEQARIVEAENSFLVDLSQEKLSDDGAYAQVIACMDRFADLSHFNLSTDVAENMAFHKGNITFKDGATTSDASGNISGKKAYAFDAQDLSKGQIVTIDASWTCAEGNVQIGLVDNHTGAGLVKTVSNGVGSVSFEITGDSNFSVFIGNLASGENYFNVSYVIS